jgi:hypothetical protein
MFRLGGVVDCKWVLGEGCKWVQGVFVTSGGGVVAVAIEVSKNSSIILLPN